MKRSITFLLLALLFGYSGFSQTQQSGLYLGGNLRFGVDKTKPENGSTAQANGLNARIEAGKFLYEDFSTGGALQILRTASPKGSKSRSLKAQLLGTARYYAGKPSIKIFFAGQLGLAYTQSSFLRYPGTDKEERTRSTQIGGAYGIGAGIAYFIRPDIALEGLVGWEGYSMPKSKSHVSFTGLKAGLSIYLDKSTGKSQDDSKRPEKASNEEKVVKGKFGNYGGKLGIGISIFDGIGCPVRYYFSPKQVLEGGLYYGAVVVQEADAININSGLMIGGGYSLFGNRLEKERKKKIRAHGLTLRINQLLGDYTTTMLSAGWAMETFKKSRPNRSFIFELGLRGLVPNYTINGEDASPGVSPYLRCHWNIFVK